MVSTRVRQLGRRVVRRPLWQPLLCLADQQGDDERADRPAEAEAEGVLEPKQRVDREEGRGVLARTGSGEDGGLATAGGLLVPPRVPDPQSAGAGRQRVIRAGSGCPSSSSAPRPRRRRRTG